MACNSFYCKHFKLNKCRKDKQNPCSCNMENCPFIEELLRTNDVLCAGCRNADCEAGYLYYSSLKKEKERPLEFNEEEPKSVSNHKVEENKPVNDVIKSLPATAYVDGSFNNSTNTYGYGLVLMVGLDTYEFYGSNNNKDVAKIRNVAGELLGAMTSVVKAKEHGCTSLIICYDYEGIEKWVTGEWKTNNEFTRKYKEYMKGCKLDIRFKKVKAHSGECYNEQADRLAKKAVGV